LSHTWGIEEVTFQDIQSLKEAKKKEGRKEGLHKPEGCCKKARSDGFKWVWIDTCCIDKSSSAELSETINSMYEWYKNSQICYAYIEDFIWPEPFPFFKLRGCRWFKRGWIWGEWIVHPPTLTSQGLSIGLPLRRKSERVYQACVAFTNFLQNNHFLCLTLSPYLNDTALTLGFQVYTIEDTGTLEFVPQVELRDNLFEYTSIYLTHTSYPSAIIRVIPREIMRLQPGKSLKVQLDDNCSVLDSFVVRRDPGAMVLPPDEFMLGYSSNIETLQAIFRIGIHGFSSSFMVAFGTRTRKNKVPWCDILFQPQVQDRNNLGTVPADWGLARPEDIQSTIRNANFGRYASKDCDTVAKMFEEPLSKIFGAFGRGPNQRLFSAASDRVVKTLSGVTLNISARRAYESVGNLPLFCGLCANSVQESAARYTLNISAKIAAGESSRSLKPSKL
jgi:hypothetical protein